MRLPLITVSLIVLAISVGCGPVDDFGDPEQPDAGTTVTDECGPDERAGLAAIRQLSFVRREGNVSRGIDIDGHVTGTDDAEGCFQPDFADPDGNEGIDNQLAVLLPTIEAAGGEALESVVQRAINGGDVLLLLETRRVDDPDDDDCVQVNLHRGEGRPVIGNEGMIEPGQTFGLDDEKPGGSVEAASLDDGLFAAGPFDLELPATIATFELELSLRDAVLEFEERPEGSMHGLIAGSLIVEELMAILDTIEDGTELLDVFRQVLRDKADLDPDSEGVCQRLSVALEFEATPAFLFADEDPDVEVSVE